MQGLLNDEERKRRAWTLAALATGSLLLWQTYWGSLLLYPFTILATWFHEMGHGIAAILAGGRFEQLAIYADGSGLAQSLIPADASVVSHALISAAGPLGPPVIGALLILASRTRRATRIALGVLAGALLLSTLIWVRSVAGWLVLPVFAVALIGVLWRGSPRVQDFVIQLLGVQACISAWRDVGYLFSDGGLVAGQSQRSDTAAIADALLLPYWFWGAAISVLIVALLAGSLRLALRRCAKLPAFGIRALEACAGISDQAPAPAVEEARADRVCEALREVQIVVPFADAVGGDEAKLGHSSPVMMQ